MDPSHLPPLALKCPVCSAGFRGTETCPRCGTSLENVMRIAARAWALRQASRTCLRTGDLPAALRRSADAWQLQQQGAGTPARRLSDIADSSWTPFQR